MLASRCRFGVKMAGFTLMIQEAGFNGIAAILWGEGMKMTEDKSKGGWR